MHGGPSTISFYERVHSTNFFFVISRFLLFYFMTNLLINLQLIYFILFHLLKLKALIKKISWGSFSELSIVEGAPVYFDLAFYWALVCATALPLIINFLGKSPSKSLLLAVIPQTLIPFLTLIGDKSVKFTPVFDRDLLRWSSFLARFLKILSFSGARSSRVFIHTVFFFVEKFSSFYLKYIPCAIHCGDEEFF